MCMGNDVDSFMIVSQKGTYKMTSAGSSLPLNILAVYSILGAAALSNPYDLTRGFFWVQTIFQVLKQHLVLWQIQSRLNLGQQHRLVLALNMFLSL